MGINLPLSLQWRDFSINFKDMSSLYPSLPFQLIIGIYIKKPTLHDPNYFDEAM